jgi:hypothetical protein
MPSSYSNLKFELISTGEQSGAWGNTTNTNLGTAVEQAIVGMATLTSGDFTANVATLTLANTNAAQPARALCLNIAAGAVSAAGTINVPAIQKPYIIINGSSFVVTVKVSGLTGVAVPAGKRTVVYNNGTDVGSQIDWLASLDITTLNVATIDTTNLEVTNIKAKDGTASITLADSTGVASFAANPTLTAGTANGVAYLNGSKVLTTGSVLVFDGSNLGVGAAPSAWGSNRSVVQLKGGTSSGGAFLVSGSATQALLGTNSYSDGTNFRYLTTAAATLYSQFLGEHVWLNAPSGTAGDVVTLTQAMTLNSSGNLGIGTSSPAAPLQLGDATQSSREIRTSTLSGAGQGGFLRGYRGGNPSFYVGDSAPISGGSAGGLTLFSYGATSVDMYTNGSLRSTLDASGNLGLGVTPSAWGGSNKAIDIGTIGNVSADAASMRVVNNAYSDSGGTFRYKTTAAAFSYVQNPSLGHTFFTAPSGTAGNAISFTQAMTLNASGNLLLGTTSDSVFGRNIVLDGVGSSGLSFRVSTSSKGFIYADANDLQIGANTGAIIFKPADIERMRLDSSGNLGIGTSSPAARLDIQGGNIVVGTTTAGNSTTSMTFGKVAAGGGTINNRITLATYGTLYGAYMEAYANLTASTATYLAFGTTAGGGGSPTERMRIDDVGNLGIGTTTTSSYRLTVLRADGNTAFFTDGTTADFFIKCASGVTTLSPTTGTLAFGTSSTERMRIDSSGNLLVGTTSTTPQGGIVVSPGTGLNSSITVAHANTAPSGNFYIGFNYNTANIGGITQSGTTAVLYNTTSDQRLKENIVNAPEFGSVIDSLQVRSFDWIADQTHQRAGFVAQELVTVAPEAVHQPANPDDMMAVDYSKLVPMLVKEIQSLRQRLAALESN